MGPMVTLGGLVIPNAETYEQLYPVTVVRHELRTDGGGPGRHRGGTGVVYEIDVHVPAEYSFRGEGLTRPTGLGVEGAGAGRMGVMTLKFVDGSVTSPPPYALQRLGPLRLTIHSPGGGGFGDPLTREVAAVVRDVRDELVSRAEAAARYGVVVAADGKTIDHARTAVLREPTAAAAAT
jgi:N-methylhydantoinase B